MGRRNQANSSTAVAPAAEPVSFSRRWLNPLAVAAIAAAAVWVYFNSFSGPFVFDDSTWIDTNKSIRHLWPIWPVLDPPNAGVIGGRPVVSLTLALNYAMGGLNVWGYHAVNLLIHILAAWTLFGLVRRTLLLPPARTPQPLPQLSPGVVEGDNSPPRFASAATPLAFAAALIWTVHPLQTAGGHLHHSAHRIARRAVLFADALLRPSRGDGDAAAVAMVVHRRRAAACWGWRRKRSWPRPRSWCCSMTGHF